MVPKFTGTKCSVFRAQPGRVSAPPINFGSVVIGGFSPRYFPPGTHHGPRSCNYPGTSKADFCSPRVSASRGPLSLMGPTIEALTRDFSPAHRPLFSGFLGLRASVVWFALSMVAFPRKRTWLNCVRDARTPDQGGADPERTPIYMGFVNWVSSTGSTVRVSSQASHSPRLSRLPISN